jgi:hypothetical protein
MDIPRGEAVVTAQVDVDTDVADAQGQEALAPVGDIAHFLAKRRWCRDCGGAHWTKAYIDPVAAAYPSLPFAEWSAAMDAIERKGGMIFVPRKRGHAGAKQTFVTPGARLRDRIHDLTPGVLVTLPRHPRSESAASYPNG